MLMRFDPFRDADQLVRQSWVGNRATAMPIDAYRRGDEFFVELDLPGVSADSIEVTVERNVLQVSAERAASYREADELLAAERPHGSVTRQLFLGDSLDTDRIRASYDDGVLTVVLPVAEEAKAHKIEICGGHRKNAVGVGS